MKPSADKLISIARLFLFVRENGENAGRWVEAIQRWCNGKKGDKWCGFWLSVVLELGYAGLQPITVSGSTADFLAWGLAHNAVYTTPEKGDIFVRLDDQGIPYHVGLVTEVTGLGLDQRHFDGISGNTSEDGTSSNGDRVAERTLYYSARTKFIRILEVA